MRLVASGLASPTAVRNAALASFGVAALVGAALALVVNPWLLVIGALAIAAAATYTGGPKPYGYVGLGEVMVLVFFGFVATLGSAYVQYETMPATAWLGALAVGLPACAILLANNIRDVDTDRAAGKLTLAVRFGAARARGLFVACIVAALVAVVVCGMLEPPALIALLAMPLAIRPVMLVRNRQDAPSLIAALITTSKFQLVLAALLAVGLWVA